MRLLLEVLVVITVTIPRFVTSEPPLIVNETTQPGHRFPTQCSNGSVVLKSPQDKPWKFFRTDSSGTAIMLNKTIDTGERSSTCWPKEAWHERGYYTCDSKEHFIMVVVGSVLNNHPTTFCNKSSGKCENITRMAVSVKEDAMQNKTLARISMCDMDVFNSKKELTVSTDNKQLIKFGGQNMDGFNVLLNQPLDYESAKSLSANITVEDGTHKPGYTMVFTVNIEDVDDEGPAFRYRVYKCNISEGPYPTMTSTGCIVEAKDKDERINASIGYSILPADTGKVNFSITTSGNINIEGAVDRERKTTYILPVKGYQIKRESDRFDIVTVIVTVTDVDDNLPKFTESGLNISVMENTQDDALIYQFTATDADEGVHAQFTYRLVESIGAFKVDNVGRLSVNDSGKLDREKQNSTVEIKVFADPHDGRVMDSNPNAALTITLLDVNDNSPRFENVSYEVTINKTHTVGNTVLTIKANDPDSGLNGKVMYSIIDEKDGSAFSIENGNDHIVLKHNLREHFKTVYHLVAKAEDQAANPRERRSSSVPVTIHVKDVNIHKPNIAILKYINISEDATPGTPVAWLNVTDKDPADVLSVNISLGNNGGAFDVHHSYLSVYTLTVKSGLDRETYDSYQLKILCSDTIHAFTSDLNIYIIDENDNHPKISEPNHFTTTENLKAGSRIGTVTATDADTGHNSDVTFDIDPESPWDANFTIDTTSGTIQTINSLDRDVLGNIDTLSFLVYAMDHGDFPLTGSATVTVTILDVNDNAPVFDVANVTFTVAELQGPGLIYTAKATDMDLGENKTIMYSIALPSTNLFTMSHTDGQLKNKRAITFDDGVNGIIQIEVKATDQGNRSKSSTQVVILQISDVNNHEPQFGQTSYNKTINETTGSGSSIISVTATDVDRSPINKKVTYWLGDTYHGIFRIGSSTGEVFLVKNVDLDVTTPQTNYSLKVFASDMMPFYNSNQIRNTSVPLAIHIAHVNEYAPTFDKGSYTCSVEENFNGSMNCLIHAKDIDYGQDGMIYYDVIKNNSLSTSFKINRTSGQLFLSSQLDYENPAQREINITISASDKGNPKKVTHANVKVRIENVNDCQPTFRMRTSISIMENVALPPGLPLFELVAKDGDRDLNKLSYEIRPPSDLFIVQRDKNIILNHRRSNFKFDYENTTVHEFTVFVNDSKHTNSKKLSLRVIPMNEFAPVFKNNYTLFIPENTEFKINITAVDKDKGRQDGMVSYGLYFPEKDNVPGEISMTKEGLLTISNLDRESVANFTFTALAIDGGEPALTGMATITVFVNGTDDNPPYYLDKEKTISLRVDEGREYINIFTSVALDKDTGYGSEISYRLLQGNYTQFKISPDGRLNIKPLSVIDEGEIRVLAFNPTNQSYTAVQHIKIEVQDVNNHVPQFEKGSYNISISETTESGSSIMRINATDDDVLPVNKKITFWLEGTHKDTFRIDPSSGDVFLVKDVDLDKENSINHYLLEVFASDMQPFLNGSQNLKVSVSLTIDVTPVNEYDPTFSQDVYFCLVNESYTGAFGCSVRASDKDSGEDGHIVYDIVNNTKLTIDKETGEINLRSQFHYSSERDVVINVSAKDGGNPNRFTFSTVKIEVKRVNLSPPNILWHDNRHLFVTEGVTFQNGTQIGTILVEDSDGNDGKPLRYSLGDDYNALFSVQDGIISLMKPFRFDFETKSRYILELIVEDENHQPVKKSITLDVINVNEYAPVITSRNFSVAENIQTTIQIVAHDNDGGNFGKFTFRVASDTIKDNVSTTDDGKMTILSLDREKLGEGGYFIVPVEAIDDGNLTGMAEVQIKVIGVNDMPPYYLKREQHVQLTVDERTVYNDLFTSMAYDNDKGDGSTIVYRLIKGNKRVFSVNTSSGILSIQSNDLYAKDGTVDLEIEASNPGVAKPTAVQKITLTIVDINDNSPRFDRHKYAVNISECEQVGSIIESVRATDDDLYIEYKTVTYWIENTEVNHMFSLNSKTGEIQLTGQLDYEEPTKRTFQFKVYATDLLNGTFTNSSHTTEANVTVHVSNCNDNKPKFTKDVYFCSVNESYTGAFGCSVRASDKDSGEDGHIVYDVVNNTKLTIDKETGEINLRSQFHYSSEREAVINVSAKDGGNPNRFSFSMVKIEIKRVNLSPPNILWHANRHLFVTEGVTFQNGTQIGTILVEDSDGNDGKPLRYSLGDDYNALFCVQDGIISLMKPFRFDFETKPQYILELIVEDEKHQPVKKSITLDVINVNEYAPVITSRNFSVVENTKNTVQIVAHDHDGGNFGRFAFRVTDDTIKDNVSTTDDGKMTILNLDREKLGGDGYFIVPVEAIDDGNLTGMAEVKIKVVGVNDMPPYYLKREQNVQLTVDERTVYKDLFTSVAYDNDKGDGSTIVYRLIKGHRRVFNVNASSGILSIQSNDLDAKDGAVDLEMEASNPGVAKPTAVQKITLTIVDINDNSPRFDRRKYAVNISECEQVGSIIETARATDNDLYIEYKTVTYWIENTEVNHMFSVNSKTGEIQLTGQLDYEEPTKRTFQFKVYATDLLNGTFTNSSHTTEANVTVHVSNCNDNKPKFTKELYLCKLPEEETGSFNCKVNASDADNLLDLTYSIPGNNHEFKISSTTGIITSIKKFDYDKPDTLKQFVVPVDVSDTYFTSSTTVLIDLENTNDNAPQFKKQEYVFNVPENTNLHYVGEVTAFDVDGNNIVYSRKGSCSSELRVLANGTLIQERKFDYEEIQRCSLTIYANDSVNTASVNVTVDVLDANDNYPQFRQHVYEIHVNETIKVNQRLLQVMANDNDTSHENKMITYDIVGGNMNDTFGIDKKNGWISTTKALNASVMQTYTLDVEAKDGGSPKLVNLATVEIFVQDINNNQPRFLYTPYKARVTENQTAQPLIKLFAEDADPDADLHFNVLSNEYSEFFSTNGTMLCVKTLDSEQIRKPVIKIPIAVSDGHFKVNTTVEVTVIDINDNSPYFIDMPANIDVIDTTPVGTDVLNVTAKDNDYTNSEVIYILSYNYGYFDINRHSGKVTLQRILDVQDKRYINLKVTAIDSGSPPNHEERNATINVVETNLYPPQFINATSTTSFEINFAEDKGNQFTLISAFDNDTGPAGSVSYSVRSLSATWPDSFSFDSHTGNLSLVQNIDFEMSSQHDFVFLIEAKDNATFPKTSTATVTIHITDVNEEPKFSQITETIYKELNATAGSTITTVTVTDPDSSENFRNFNFTIFPTNGYFKIESLEHDSHKAIIKAAKTLSISGTYNITVKVTDGGGLSDAKKLTIVVSNITGLQLNATLSEEQDPPIVLMNLLEKTNLSQGTWFSLVSSKDSGNFTIWQNGTFVANKKFDREMTPEFKVEIKGNKNLSGEVILTAQIQMHVTVLDKNDNPPKFNQTSYILEISENTPNGTNVGSVTASDPDKSTQLYYTINPASRTFGIQPSSGEIYLLRSVDYESTSNYSITVICNDTVHTASATVIVTIKDNNDVWPKFDNDTFIFIISESQRVGPLPGLLVTATDPDTEDQGNLKYSILPDDSPIGIEQNGQLSLKRQLDYDTMKTKQVGFTVEATDMANHTSNVSVTVIVMDANDNAPNFTQKDYYYHVPEGITVPGHNFSVQATDKDYGNNSKISFSLKSVPETLFSITTEGQTGYLHILQKLDRESKSGDHDANGSAVYTLTVVAKDHGDKPLTSTALVHITVDDTNDCPPKFSSDSLKVNVQEGTAVGTNIVTVTTTDCDLLDIYKTVTYSFAKGSTDVFNITSDGHVILNKPVSLNQRQQYNLGIVASDGNNTAKANLTVNILDANDHSPNFTQPVYTFNVTENVSGRIVGEVLATDDDPGENGNVSYTITSGNDGGVFSIRKVNSSGVITVISQLDREQVKKYTLIITGEDGAKTDNRQGTCTVVVQVEDQNDNSPEFDSVVGYSGYIKEDAKNDTQIELNTPINAMDKDNGINGTEGIKYSILPKDHTPFCINDTTGIVTVCGTIDRETKDKYSLKVIAADRLGSADGRPTSANLTIIVTDVNDNAPDFIDTPYTYSVPENASAGTSVGRVIVTDADENGLQNVRLRITHGSHENFYIETSQNDTILIGTIFVSGVLDREDRSSFNLTIDADDSVQASSTAVAIDILDVNDNAPVFNESHIEVKIMEESEPGIIYTVAAYDLDEPNTNNSEIVFHFDQKTISEFESSFGIYENGSLFTKQKLDRESITSYSLTIEASDDGQSPMTSSMSITVTVLDINDNAPIFCDKPPCTLNDYIVETQPVGSIIGLPLATDPDQGDNGTIVYSIQPSPASKYFKMDNKTGLVTIARPIVVNTLIEEHIVNVINNSTERVTIELTIVAKDKGPAGGRNSTLKMLVTVEPINDNAPVFEEPCDFHITEEQPNGTFVGDCRAVIPNETYSHMAYTLIAGFDSDSFQINKYNGTIRTKTRLDREEVSHYTLSVQVTDGRTPERTAFAAVKIAVDDINDNQAVFYQSPIHLEIPENAIWSHTINTSAVDRDEGPNGLLTFTIDHNYGGLFVLNGTSGIVTVNGTFDYEQQVNYTFHISAKDQGSVSKTSSVLVTITVVDVNDNAPVFHNVKLEYEVPENQTGKIFILNATDADSGYNGRVEYRLLDTDEGPFNIDPYNGWVYVSGHLDYETKSVYHLSFEAMDQGLQPQSTVVKVTVNIIDVYDYALKFDKDVYEANVNASAPVGTTVIDLSIHTTGITYELSGSDSGLFSIGKMTGVVTVKEPLDVHNRQNMITVSAVDGTGQRANCRVIIYISNHEVLFPKRELEVRIPENINGSTLLLDLNTTEEHDGLDMLYSITGIEPSDEDSDLMNEYATDFIPPCRMIPDVFRIVPETGAVYCDKALDRELHGEYNIYISAFVSSSHRNKRAIDDSSSTVKLTVHVDDKNDNSPIFTHSQQSLFRVPGDAKASYIVTKLQAHDPDLGENGRIFYSSTGYTDVFGVDRETGSVQTLVDIANRQEKSFRLNITAYDGSGDPGPNSTLDMQILVVPREDRLVLQVNMSLTRFHQKQAYFIRNMSNLLGFDVQLENTESHHEQTDNGTKLDLSRTDMYFHGVNKTTGAVVPFDIMMGLINKNYKDLNALFGNKAMDVTQVKKEPYKDPSAITIPIIGLFCVAIFIFVGSFIAIIMALYQWSRMNKQKEMIEKQKQSDVKLGDFEMNTLRSHASQTGGIQEAAGAVNPVFLETEFAKRGKPKEKKVKYETQELRMQFAEEPLRFSDGILNNNGARSVADSALENTSLTSNEQLKSEASGRPVVAERNTNGSNEHKFGLKAGEGPVMTSSPRISKDFDAEGNIAILGQGYDNRPTISTLKMNNEGTALAITTEVDKSGETDTDVDLIDDRNEGVISSDSKPGDAGENKKQPDASSETVATGTQKDPIDVNGGTETTNRMKRDAADVGEETDQANVKHAVDLSAVEATDVENEDDEITSF